MTDLSLVRQRRYDVFSDYSRVYDFLHETWDFATMNSYLLPAYFEYAQHHSMFDFRSTHRIGLWESDCGRLVGIAAYEMELGDAHLHHAPGYEALLPQMLDWAEAELWRERRDYDPEGTARALEVWITDAEPGKRDLLVERGYEECWRDEVMLFDLTKPLPETSLPEGFTLVTGADIDYWKLAECFLRGFGHDDPMTRAVADGSFRISLAPHANPELTTAVMAPDGRYACGLGMWVDSAHGFAYLEPLATHPDFRGLGLARHALVDAMRRTIPLGARVCDGGANPFYAKLGFELHITRVKYKRVWP